MQPNSGAEPAIRQYSLFERLPTGLLVNISYRAPGLPSYSARSAMVRAATTVMASAADSAGSKLGPS